MGLDKNMEIGSTSSAKAVKAPCKVGDLVKIRAPGIVPYMVTVDRISDDGRKITVFNSYTDDSEVFSLMGANYKSAFGEQLVL